MTASIATGGYGLDARYGRTPVRRRRRTLLLVLGAVVLAAAAIVWAVWSGLGGTGATTLDLQTTSYHLVGDRAVTVGWQVGGDVSEALTCRLIAEAEDHSVVGVKDVAVPPGTGASRGGTTTVLVTRTAVTGLISSCRHA